MGPKKVSKEMEEPLGGVIGRKQWAQKINAEQRQEA